MFLTTLTNQQLTALRVPGPSAAQQIALPLSVLHRRPVTLRATVQPVSPAVAAPAGLIYSPTSPPTTTAAPSLDIDAPRTAAAPAKTYKVAVVGSGAWASAATKLAAHNALASEQFDTEVSMWVRNPDLAADVNSKHENTRYLPGVQLGANVVAQTDLATTVEDADLILLCVPHQFAHDILCQVRGKIKTGALVVSLVKGMEVLPHGAQTISEMVQDMLQVPCGVLMGANIAEDIGAEQLGEGTVAFEDPEHAFLFAQLFGTPYFHVSTSNDVLGAEVCGMLKNVVALAVGMVQGLGLGMNSQAAIMRVGLNEMRSLAKELYPSVQDATFFESCGVADLMASCMGGRNRKVAHAYTQAMVKGEPRTWDELEAQLLNGQKLQGVLSSHEVQQLIAARGLEARFPLITTINKVVRGVLQPSDVLRFQEAWWKEEEEGVAAAPVVQRSSNNIVPLGGSLSRKQQRQAGTLGPVAA